MLYDSIDNLAVNLPEFIPMLKELVPFLEAVQIHTFDEIKKMDFGPIELRFGEYNTQPADKIPFEAHVKHWDLQIVLSGEEYIGYAPLETLFNTITYNEKEDIAFYSGKGQMLKLEKGMAILLAPWDAHCPGIMIGDIPIQIKKIIVKL
ncbi:MAG: YhcH/YjgK/YiaL family protein [Synergistaceae bacterium]|nr:YhcH/YjgK/YiaL family protein [Synergistaceae bacterium]